MRRIKKTALVLIGLVVLAYSTLEVGHLLRFGHLAPLGLHADVVTRKADYGIPGISKVYEPRLSNFGIAPKTVAVCKVLEDWDSFYYVTEISNSIEKWNPSSKTWESIFGDSTAPSGCNHTATRLWPLQSVSGGEVAVAGYDVFAIGDQARFVLLPGNHKPIPAGPIVIDEHATVAGAPFRVRIR